MEASDKLEAELREIQQAKILMSGEEAMREEIRNRLEQIKLKK